MNLTRLAQRLTASTRTGRRAARAAADLIDAHLRGRELLIVVAPHHRARYLPHLFASTRYRWLYCELERTSHRSLSFLARLVSSTVRLAVSDLPADLDLAPLAHAAAPPLVLAWNDELELRQWHRRLPAGARFASLFAEHQGCLGPVPVHTLRFHVPAPPRPQDLPLAEPRIVYAGQVRPDAYLHDPAVASRAAALRDVVLEVLNGAGARYASLYDLTADGDLGLKLRHLAINTYRRALLLRLIQVFGDRLLLIGPDMAALSAPAWRPACTAEELAGLYRTSRVCLDLGSQCGREWLTPRSAEIVSANPASFVQPELPGNPEVFNGPLRFRLFQSASTAIDACQRVLDLSHDERERHGWHIADQFAARSASADVHNARVIFGT